MKLTIPGEFPSLNEYIDAERGNRYAGARMKQDCTDTVAWLASIEEPVETYPVRVSFHWFAKNRRRDIDNIVSFGQKVCLDGLVRGGAITNDSMKYVRELHHTVSVDSNNPRVEIEITEVQGELDS